MRQLAEYLILLSIQLQLCLSMTYGLTHESCHKVRCVAVSQGDTVLTHKSNGVAYSEQHIKKQANVVPKC